MTEPTHKLVEIRLAALTRVEYTEVVEVPGDISADELNDIINRRYSAVDGSEFSSDPEYWERSTCYATDVDAREVATVKVTRQDEGLSIEPMDGPDAKDAPAP